MGGTTLPILVQSITVGSIPATDTEDSDTSGSISAVDLSRSYIFIPGHESGEIRCDGVPKCDAGAFGTTGFNTDGQVQQFCVDMPDDGGGTGTIFRVRRQGAPGPLPAGAPGCRANWEKILVVEYT